MTFQEQQRLDTLHDGMTRLLERLEKNGPWYVLEGETKTTVRERAYRTYENLSAQT